MSKKRDERKKIISNMTITSNEVWQSKPYTAVKVKVWYKGCSDTYEAIGFAKVYYKWDADYGVTMAVAKALTQIAKSIAKAERRQGKVDYRKGIV